MPSEKINCMWDYNTAIYVTEIGAFVNTTLIFKVLWKAEYFQFSFAVFLLSRLLVFLASLINCVESIISG